MDSLFTASPCRGELIIVDDSPTILAVLKTRLSRAGYRVTTVENGAEALALVDSQDFDAMLLDMTMPGMSGLRVLRDIRRSGAAMPVMMMTARTDAAAAVEALREGADDHIVKPFDSDVLIARIDRMLDRARDAEGLRRLAASLNGRLEQRAVEIGELRLALTDAQAQLGETAVI